VRTYTRVHALCGQNAEVLNVEAGGTYSYHCVLNGSFVVLFYDSASIATIQVSRCPGGKSGQLLPKAKCTANFLCLQAIKTRSNNETYLSNGTDQRALTRDIRMKT
jgi:hypothetical protein